MAELAAPERSPYAPPASDVAIAVKATPSPIAVMLLQVVLLLQLAIILLWVLWQLTAVSGWDLSSAPDVWVSLAVIVAYGVILAVAFIGLVKRSFWGRWVSVVGLLGFGCLFLIVGLSGVFRLSQPETFRWESLRMALAFSGLGLALLLWMYLVAFSSKARRYFGAIV